MISGLPLKWRKTPLYLTLLVAPWVHASDTSLDALMQALAAHPVRQATFTEKKYLDLVTQPLQSSGTLSFRAPDHLDKITLQPEPETLTLDGNTLTIQRPDHRTHRIALEDYPEIAGFINGLRATLQGNRHDLEAQYTLQLSGYPGLWTLTLVPRDPAMRRLFQELVIRGDGGEIQFIRITQTNGDHSDMSLLPDS